MFSIINMFNFSIVYKKKSAKQKSACTDEFRYIQPWVVQTMISIFTWFSEIIMQNLNQKVRVVRVMGWKTTLQQPLPRGKVNTYIIIYIVFVKRIKDEGAVKMHYICFRTTCNQIVKLKQQLEIIQNSSDIIKNKDFEYMVEKHRSICQNYEQVSM